MNYPTQKAVAYKVTYGPKWKAGESPLKVKLGTILFPIGEGIEDAAFRLRKAFPLATDSRLYDETGHWYCAGCL